MTTLMNSPDGWINQFANMVGAPEPAIRLLITILTGYPIAFTYRYFVQPIQTLTIHNIYFALSGMGLCYFNYGRDTYHSFIAVLTTYLFMRVLYRTPIKFVAVNFIFHMSYLLLGYYYTESNDYDILWTMPHCVLVLRMIGCAFDIADGTRPKNELSKDQQECAIKVQPSFLELLSYAYFPASFLVGPQFPFQRYRRFLYGEFREKSGFTKTGLTRLAVGVIYLAVRQLLLVIFPDDYFLSKAYGNETFLKKVIYLGIWGKSSLYKYISIWLICEGALMCLGFSYNGNNVDGTSNWYGCSNVKLWQLETGTNMQHYVQSFNVNTNLWVAQYVYKRLKFLNNRTFSYMGALLFLAVWHGFHSGYYMSFLLEYLTITTEKQIENFYLTTVKPKLGTMVDHSLYKHLLWFLLKFYNITYMGFCLTPFIFLSYNRWITVFRAVNFYGFYYLGGWLIIRKLYGCMKLIGNKYKNSATVFSTATDLSPIVNTENYKESKALVTTTIKARNMNNLDSIGQDENYSKATDLSPTLQSDKKAV